MAATNPVLVSSSNDEASELTAFPHIREVQREQVEHSFKGEREGEEARSSSVTSMPPKHPKDWGEAWPGERI